MNALEEKNIPGKQLFNKDNITLLLGSLLMAFTLWTSATSPLSPMLQRTIVLLIMVYITLLFHPVKNGRYRAIDWLLTLGATVSIGYLMINWKVLAYRVSYAPVMYEVILGLCIIIVIIELTRRGVGLPLAIIAVLSILYARFGNYLPAAFAHKGYDLSRLISNQYLTFEGIFGTMLGTLSTVIAPFVLFGSVLQAVGVGDLIIDSAYLFARNSKGGPAKMAVIASCLFGTISGSSTSNVMTTGCTTIPLMKNTGYERNFAGAVEAAASTGGQIMPPVMGVAAFLMSYVTGIPYITIAIAALIPALFYYAGIFIEVDLEARRIGLKPLKEREIPVALKDVLKRAYLLFPFVVLVYLMLMMWSPAKSAFWALAISLVLACLKKRTRINLKMIKKIILDFAAGMKTVSLACATAGIVIGALNLTGATLRLTYAFVEVSQGNQLLLMICIAALCIILGMGLPTPAAYSVAAAFAAPALVQVSIPELSAHLFVLYYACLSSITPPVAIAAYAAAGLSGGSPMKTGWTSCRLALVGFIVPFMFVYGPSLLIGQADILSTALASISGLIGVFFLSVATIGYLKARIGIVERILFVVPAMFLIHPGMQTDLIGLGLGAVLLGVHIIRYNSALKTAS